MTLEEIKKIRSADLTLKVNYLRLPVTRVDNIDDFNDVYMYWRNQELQGKINYGITRTKSGGISIKRLRLPRYEITADANNGAELVVLAMNEDDSPAFYRFQYRAYKKEVDEKGKEVLLSGHQAYISFREELLKDNIKIEDYFIEDGAQVKKTIEKPIIKLERDSIINKTISNVHHVDIHNSYPAGMAEFIPEWRNTIERIYNERYEDPIKYKRNKSILVNTVGYFQSTKYFKARLAHISKYAIQRNNEKIRDMANWLKSTGRIVLAYNTDGIWFAGESTNLNTKVLGEFVEDHTNCTIRFKSAGAYEYIEGGKYTPVIRGFTRLDRIKSRDSWQWGDIYQKDCELVMYTIDRERGIVVYEN